MIPALLGIGSALLVALLALVWAVTRSKSGDRDELNKAVKDSREETTRALTEFGKLIMSRMDALQNENTKRLQEIRETVDEKLETTLGKKLGESFEVLGKGLEKVHKGLGEMSTLASGVGDLKRVLMNVKTRGILGEVQLQNLLEQILTTEQYACNVATKPESSDRVEYAVRLPGGDDTGPLWLPIDAKFPQEYYERYVDACQTGHSDAVDETRAKLVARLKEEAATIRKKYVSPPHTTDFAIMFLPFEGLYATVLEVPGLFQTLSQDYQVAVVGPTNLGAFLNSLQMGFRTLTIQKRSSEVWVLLGVVQAEFKKFGTLLDKTRTKLLEATQTLEDASTKSRTLERKLRSVEKIAGPDAIQLEEHVEEGRMIP